MRRFIVVSVVGLGALGARHLARSCGCVDFERMIERMPENAPPKWMFRNVSAIRRNTDSILELLESERRAPAGRPPQTAA